MVEHLLGMQGGAAGPRGIRASQSTTNFNTTTIQQPQDLIVSDRDRHLFPPLGTETTIGDASTQDPMFVRFSNQEDLNTLRTNSNQHWQVALD